MLDIDTIGWPGSLKGVLGQLLDLAFPPLCPVCSSPLPIPSSNLLCPACLAHVKAIRGPICTRCGIPFETSKGPDHLCWRCIDQTGGLDWTRSLFEYHSTVSTLIKGLKFLGDKSCLKALTWISRPVLNESLARLSLKIHEGTCIIPVPLHPSRLRDRTFNQSLLLARKLFPGFQVKNHLVMRVRNNPPQTGLSAKLRRQNVKGVFAVSSKKSMENYSRFIIVDDVMTTGSTLEEMARVLKREGAQNVGAITVARSIPAISTSSTSP
ncbi:MAG: ComF family protein [Thermodesulfobacteria bacterium]|nr:ComF family protein [Thermodesulfobacteriota bacterium]